MNLHSFHRWALKLQPLRIPSMGVAAASWVVLAVLLLDATDEHALAVRLLLILSLWALLLIAFISLFNTSPPAVLPALRWQDRWFAKLQYWLFCAMALSYGVVVVMVLGLSVKLGFMPG
jgi:hypothetical protein